MIQNCNIKHKNFSPIRPELKAWWGLQPVIKFHYMNHIRSPLGTGTGGPKAPSDRPAGI